MRTVRLLVLLLIAAGGLALAAPAAEAGGASFIMDKGSYEPGDRAVGRTGINWAHSPLLGAPEDGPYYAYLVPVASMALVTTWPTDPATLPGAVFVDVIEITEGPIEIVPGRRMGPHGATIEFEVPDLPDGQYAIDHCNRPCTTALADITGGGLWIGPPPIEPIAAIPPAPTSTTTTIAPTTTTVPPTTATTTPTTDDTAAESDDLVLASASEGGGGAPFGPFGAAPILAGALLVVVAVVGLVCSRSRVRVVSVAPRTEVGRLP